MSIKPFSISAKVLISDSENRCLFIQRSESSRWNPAAWDIPGGKLDPGEIFMDGLLREVQEETGIDVTIDSLLGSNEDETNNFRIIHVVMNGTYQSGEITLSTEHIDFKWVLLEDALDMNLCDFVKRIIEFKLKANTFFV